MKKVGIHRVYNALLVGAVMGPQLLSTSVVEAAKKETKATATPEPSYATDPFAYLSSGSDAISKNEALRQTSASWYQLMVVLAVIGFMMSLITFAIVIVLSRSSPARTDAKKTIGVKIGIFTGVLAFAFFIRQVFLIAKAFM